MRKLTRRDRWIFGGLLLGVVIHAWLSNQPWIPYADSRVWGFLDPDQYALRRRYEAFAGVPFDLIVARLATILPQDATVALGPKMQSDPFLQQRACEVFYPRRLSRTSENVIEIAFTPPPSSVVLGRDTRGRNYGLMGRQREDTLPSVLREEFTLHLPWLILTVLACFGIGGVGAAAWAHLWKGEGTAQFSASMMTCAVLVGITAALLTWLQLPLWGVAFHGAGLLAFGVLLRPANLRAAIVRLRPAIRQPALWLALSVGGLLLMRLQAAPITKWDGRSIWLFQAKQAFFSGTFSFPDLTSLDCAFGAWYPKLFPAWLALFAAIGPVWNERMASLGIAVLAAGFIWALAVVAVERLGALRAIALVCVLFWSVQELLLGGYVDGYLLFALVTGTLGLSEPRTRAVGWLALLVASLLKREGLFLAVVVAVVHLLQRTNPQTHAARWRPMLLFLPAVLHLVWGFSVGFGGGYSEIPWGRIWTTPGYRSAMIGLVALKIISSTPLLLEGVLAAIACLILLSAGAKAIGRGEGLERSCLLIAAIWTAWLFIIFLVTPKNLVWHLVNALDRLLLHPAALALVAFLSVTRNLSEAGDRTSDAPTKYSAPQP